MYIGFQIHLTKMNFPIILETLLFRNELIKTRKETATSYYAADGSNSEAGDLTLCGYDIEKFQ
jgi:hypothetical protein